jgi:hypothetical protein
MLIIANSDTTIVSTEATIDRLFSVRGTLKLRVDGRFGKSIAYDATSARIG